MKKPTILATLLLSASATLAAPCRLTTFDTAPWFHPPAQIAGIAAADFNGDGHPDLVIASAGLKINLNDGYGGFANTLTISDTLNAASVVVIDFDRDGAPDILARDATNGALLVFANRRTSFAQVWRDDEFGYEPVVGDFNGDGRPDFARRNHQELLVYVGAGDGTFKKLRFSEPTGFAAALVAGDLDGDGRDDIVESFVDVQQLTIRRGSAANVLEAPSQSAKFRERLDNVVVGDFDGSGHLDIVTQPSALKVLEVLHDPGTSPSAAPVWQRYDGSYRHIVGDFTGDGVPDLLSSFLDTVMLGVLGSQPTFQAQQPSSFALPIVFGTFMAAADFDGNGTLDVAVANQSDVSILFNRGGGRFIAPRHIGAIGVRAVVDLDHDGIDDLIADTNPIVWFGNADGTYRAGSARRPAPADLVEVADLNGDGNLDMVVIATDPNLTGDGHLWLLLGNGGGSFTTKDLGAFGKSPASLAVVDLDRDGKLDLVVGDETTVTGPPVTVAYGRGDGTFEPSIDLPGTTGGDAMRIGDLDGDGLPDIVAGNPYGRTFLKNLGGRKFRATSTHEAIVGKLQVADMNGDGKADLIETSFLLGRVAVRLGRGDGAFLPDLVSDVPISQASSLDVADMNGDGNLDLVINASGSGGSTYKFAVLFGKGNGQLEPAQLWPSAGSVLRIVDINHDGRLDIVNNDVVRLNLCKDRRRAAGR